MPYLIIAIAAIVIGVLIGVYLGRDKCRPLPSYEERARKELEEKLAEATKTAKEKIRLIEAETEVFKANQKLLCEESRTAYNNELHKMTGEKLRIEAENRELAAKKSAEIESMEVAIQRLRDNMNMMQERYEQDVVKQKKRIIGHERQKREAELKALQEEYDELISRTTAAISQIRARMDEWSNAERIAYEERLSRDEVARYNKLMLTEISIDEIKELHGACSKMRLANPTPLYKAIYEIYFRGPVKDLGVRLNATGVCGIYKITNTVSGKTYIGQSVNIAERWKQHIKRGTKCEVGTLAGAGLYEAMFTEGIWNFSFQVLEECDKAMLNERESF